MKIHFIGSRGASISRLMEITQSLGVEVSGSDIITGHNAKNTDGANAVVYSSAVKCDNHDSENHYCGKSGKDESKDSVNRDKPIHVI